MKEQIWKVEFLKTGLTEYFFEYYTTYIQNFTLFWFKVNAVFILKYRHVLFHD